MSFNKRVVKVDEHNSEDEESDKNANVKKYTYNSISDGEKQVLMEADEY